MSNSAFSAIYSLSTESDQISTTGSNNPQLSFATNPVFNSNIVIESGFELQFHNPADTFHTSMKAGAQGIDISLTLPLLQGAANTFLQNNGSGVLSWVLGNAGTVTSVSGTANQITSSGGVTPVIALASAISGITSLAASSSLTGATLVATANSSQISLGTGSVGIIDCSALTQNCTYRILNATGSSRFVLSVTNAGNQTISDTIQMLNTTNSSSTSTGTLVINGGLGVAEDVYASQFFGDFFGLQASGHYYTANATLDQTIPSNTSTAILFGNPISNAGITYSSGIFTVHVAGIYTISASVLVSAVTSVGINRMLIGVNGNSGGNSQGTCQPNATGISPFYSLSMNIYLNNGDTVAFYFYSGEVGGATIANSSIYGWFGMNLLEAIF